jgi:hypothetical protein
MATETYKVIAQASPAAATLTPIYTVPALTQAVISSIIVANRSAVRTTFRISVAVGGAADSNAQYLAYDADIEGNETREFTIGTTLSAGDVIRAYATLATVSFNVFGTEIV